ncbi:MAG: hypothetical protein ACLVEF_07875 [Bifidobacterium bifidum]
MTIVPRTYVITPSAYQRMARVSHGKAEFIGEHQRGEPMATTPMKRSGTSHYLNAPQFL